MTELVPALAGVDQLKRQFEADGHQLLAILDFNSLIQLGSSSKGSHFLWTASLFSSESKAWKLFNQVFPGC